MRAILKASYGFFITFPDRMYPFAAMVGGKRVRGRRAYEYAVRRALRRYGMGRIGYRLGLYREVFHFIGSVLFITAATLVSQDLFGSNTAVYVLLIAAIVALAVQEFYLHPKHYGQHFMKGVADWLTWVVPMLIYIFR